MNAFAIDTGSDGGSQGPWISWTSNGSAEKAFPPRSWVLRGKDDAGNKTETVIPAFVNGCVMDLDTLKLGWEKEGAKGSAPERRWNPSVSQATEKPDNSVKQNGKPAWTRALTIRCAIGGGQAATWEQGSFGAYDAFSKLAKQISAQWTEHSQNGVLLPLVIQTGVEKKDLPSGSSSQPILSISKWVPRPDCLKAKAPVIATETQVQQAAAATTQAAQQPAATGGAVTADIAF